MRGKRGTSAYYGLYGERIFEDYEERFLRKDIDARLGFNLFRPIDFFRLMFTKYTRSDMDDAIFSIRSPSISTSTSLISPSLTRRALLRRSLLTLPFLRL